jgi:DNA primase
MNIDPSTTKYLIQARMEADGIIEKPDVVGAVFGQTEGLLGEELDLRDLQKSGRIGRIEVDVTSKRGRSEGAILVPSSLDQIETSILAAALETIDRIGPCKAQIRVEKVEDVRITKRNQIVDRAKELLTDILASSKTTGLDLLEEVRQSVQISEIGSYGPDRLPAGPNVKDSDAIIVVEGRQDVINLLKCGIKNAIAVEGTNIPPTIEELSKERVVTVFVDGDRGGDLILKELLQVAEVDFIARAPRGREVEELTLKQVMKALRNKIPAEQYVEMYGVRRGEEKAPARREARAPKEKARPAPAAPPKPAPAPAAVSPNLEKYRDLLGGLRGSSKAKILTDKGKVSVEVPVRELVETLKAKKRSAKAVVFDGIITQRILDIAEEIGMKAVVGTKLGTVRKQPPSVEVWTQGDFSP